MKAASLAEIKRELVHLESNQLTEICLRLGRFKKDNKELLTYLLFEAANEGSYVQAIKDEIDQDMSEINTSHTYYAKKTLRKILRNITKYIRYSGSKQTEVEVLLHFCAAIKGSRIRIYDGTVIGNMFQRQILKIKKAYTSLHEDLQADYEFELNQILNS